MGHPRPAATIALLCLLLLAMAAHAQPDPAVELAARALQVAVDEAGEKWFEMVAAQPDDPDEQAFADWLAARDDIAEAVVAGTAVEARTVAGITVRFCDYQPGIKSAGGLGPSPGSAGVMQAIPATLRTFGEVAPGGKALIIDPSGDIIDDPSRDIQRMLEHANYTVVESRGGVSAFAGMADAAVTIVSSHGGTTADNKHFMVVGEEHKTTSLSSLTEYYTWLVTGQVGLQRSVTRNKVTKKPEAVVTLIDIYDTWFDRSLSSLPNNAAVFFFTCESMTLQTAMWPILRKKGASFFLGFKGGVESTWGLEWLKRYIDRLTGANIYDPWDTGPPRRPQTFEDAFTYIMRSSYYRKDPYFAGTPEYRVDFPEAAYSLAPHIDQAIVLPVRDDQPNYEVLITGSLGRADESQVYCNGQPVPFTSTIGGNGGSYRVVIPLETTGPLVVNDKWGRQSNQVMISRFTGEVEFDYDDLEMAGTVKLKYDSLVIGSRLYRMSRRGLEFGGLPGLAVPWIFELDGPPPNTAPYSLLSGYADWDLEWRFDSVKRIGPVRITAVGRGRASGRGAAPERDMPQASVGVSLTPIPQSQSATTCRAEVWPSATVGPITVTYISRTGRKSEEKWAICAGFPATGTFDLTSSKLSQVTGVLGGGGSWRISPVTITPNPYDLDAPA